MSNPSYEPSDADEARLAALVATATYWAGVLAALRGPYLEADAQAEASARAVRAEHYARAKRRADAADAYWRAVRSDTSLSVELRADAMEDADDCGAMASYLCEDFAHPGYRIDDEYAHARGLKPSKYPFEQAPPGPQYNRDGTPRELWPEAQRSAEEMARDRAETRASYLAAAERDLANPNAGVDRAVPKRDEGDDAEIPF